MTKIEELEKQVSDIKATIEAMKAKTEEVKQEKFKFKFKFKYPEECYLLRMDEVDDGGGKTSSFLKHGRYRLTEEAAYQSLDRNKRANRLEALAEMMGGLKNWRYGEDNYSIYLSGNSAIWAISLTSMAFCPEVVYMTEECAEEICRMLNNGEFKL